MQNGVTQVHRMYKNLTPALSIKSIAIKHLKQLELSMGWVSAHPGLNPTISGGEEQNPPLTLKEQRFRQLCSQRMAIWDSKMAGRADLAGFGWYLVRSDRNLTRTSWRIAKKPSYHGEWQRITAEIGQIGWIWVFFQQPVTRPGSHLILAGISPVWTTLPRILAKEKRPKAHPLK